MLYQLINRNFWIMRLVELAKVGDGEGIKRELRQIVPEYQPQMGEFQKKGFGD